jgi:hypothetical protein
MAKLPNTSHAVMAQRHEAADSLDDFPTPPWATRALVEHVIGREELSRAHCLEPACGRGHMARALRSYCDLVTAADVADYGYGARRDFLASRPGQAFDWVITNPPFRLAEEFLLQALPMVTCGVALLVRTVFIESVGRLDRVFSKYPPSTVAQFAERVPMVRARLDPKASTATGYAWVVWRKPLREDTRLVWIPQCRKRLELASDYVATQFVPREAKSRGQEPRIGNSGDLFAGSPYEPDAAA